MSIRLVLAILAGLLAVAVLTGLFAAHVPTVLAVAALLLAVGLVAP